MTFCYQNQCEDTCCYSPCNYKTLYNCRTYDCGSPCGYWGYRGQCNTDCYPSYRSCYPYSSCYTRQCSYKSYYPCYPCYPC